MVRRRRESSGGYRDSGLRVVGKGTGSRRVLVVSPTPVAPLLGGASARIRTLVAALEVLGFEVHFAYIERDPGDEDAMRSLFGERFHPIPYRRQRAEASLLARLRRRLLQLARVETGWLWGVDDLYDPGVEPCLRELHARLRFDVVIVEYVFFSRALDVFGPEVRKLVDLHDVFGNRHKLYVKAGQDPHWISVRPEDEVEALRRADYVLAIQPEEAQAMRERGLACVASVSHIVELAARPIPVPPAPVALFVGAANDANAHGLQWFFRHVWPIVRAGCPQARVHVAGAVSDACPALQGVHAEGRVSDERLEALYRDARVAINPVFIGSGQSIKVLEAMGHGVSVVASSVGLRGIVDPEEPGVHRADDPAAFAAAMIRLFTDDELAARASEAAHAFARRSNAAQLAALERACSTLALPGVAGRSDDAPDGRQAELHDEGRVGEDPAATARRQGGAGGG